MPTVSIILPTFNRPRFLPAAVESVLAQTFSDWELIVADDGSDGEARRYIQSLTQPRVKVISLSHSGNPARVRNAGIEKATGDYLAFIDSDDIWMPRKLEKQVAALRTRPDHTWCYTHSDYIDENGDSIMLPLPRYPGEGWILESLLCDPRVQIGMPGVMVDRKLVLDLGGFDLGQEFAEDLDLYLRLAMRSRVVVVAERLYSIRVHGEHYSQDVIGMRKSRGRLYRKMAHLVADPRLRSFCRRRQAHESLNEARLHGERGDERALWRTLGASVMSSWPYPEWWFGGLKAAVRPHVPAFVLSRYRRRRRSGTTRV
jgi:glycosyltransferase involved in cell wall biosynthesis